MNTDRRHELKENDLVHLLEQGWTYASANAKRIGLFVGAGLALILVISLTNRSRSAAVEDTWRRQAELKFENIDEARKNLAPLKALSDHAPDQAFILDSVMKRGSVALRFARSGLNNTLDKAMNDAARDAFNELLQRFPSNPLAIGVAHLGLATVEENEFAANGNPAHKEKALAFLNKIIDNRMLDTTPFNRQALDRRSSLDAVFQKVEFAPPLDADAALSTGLATPSANP